MYILGVDIGTGSTKAVASDTEGKILFNTQVSYTTLVPQQDFAEQDPEEIWKAFKLCLQKVMEKLGESPQAISFSSAMHSLIPVNDKGHPLTNMIIWADNRSADIAKRIRASQLGKTLYEQNGTPIHAMAPLSKIVWLKENSDTFQHTARFISIKEYIWYKLFHVFEIDYSIASATGLFDIEKLQWSEAALSLCGISAAQLSTPVNTDHLRSDLSKEVAQTLNIPADTKFIIGASDGCLANLGSFAIAPGTAALTIGTSGAIRIGNTRPTFDFETMPFNYRLDENTFITGGPINNGGVALKWYVQNFLEKQLQSSNDYNALLKDVPNIAVGSNGLLFLPYILGERAPIWNSDSCGVFFGITANHKQDHFTRAVLEGICLTLYQIGKALEKKGLTIHQIHVSGGFIHSEIWVQILADIFGKKVILVNAEDASAIGAIYLALKKLGYIESYNTLEPPPSTIYEPNENNHDIYDKHVLPRFEQLYKALALDMAIFHQQKSTQMSAVNI
jgi:gluconokinase